MFHVSCFRFWWGKTFLNDFGGLIGRCTQPMADEFGYSFLSRENQKAIIEIFDYEKNDKELREFPILQKFDFDPERQCSSIIVKDLKNNKIAVYTKGSDRKIFNSINEFSKKNILPSTQEHVDQFARQGLRTLCYCYRIIDEKEYYEWEKEYEDMAFDKEDMYLIFSIQNKNPIYGSYYKKRKKIKKPR